MLADIDNESDTSSTPSPSQTQASKPLNDVFNGSSPRRLSRTQSPSARNGKSAIGQSGSDTDDSDDAVRKPQGRAARRMLVSRSISPQPPVEKIGKNAEDEEDELYSVTPMRRRAPAELPSRSPIDSESGGGLFVSPTKSIGEDADDEDDLPVNPLRNKEKLAELVAKKRTERLAKEAEEKERDQQTASSDLPEGVYDDADKTPQDRTIEKIMSDASRPARKASKKALEEMERETQRLARQQALAHQMKVKKKFTTSDLFAKFNFRQPAAVDVPANQSTGGDTTASSAPNSDGIEERTKNPHSTPPSSPPSPLDRQQELVDKGALSKLVPVRQDSIASLAEFDEDEDLPDMVEVMKGTQKEKSISHPAVAGPQQDKKGLKLARLGKKAALPSKDDSDDDLEIIQQLPAHLRAFEKVAGSNRPSRPADSKAIHNLKHLSHFNFREGQPRKKGSRPSVDPKALETQLRKRAKEQARLQQLERIEELRAKGIEVQTVEEREKEAEAFENLLEKARQEAVELRKAEKAARKEAGEEIAMDVSEDEDEDEDYVGSGSEEEDGEEGDEERERDENGMFDEAAEETDEEEDPDAVEEEIDAEVEMDEEASENDESNKVDLNEQDQIPAGSQQDDAGSKPGNAPPRKTRMSRVIKDDEDEDEAEAEMTEPAENNAEQDDDPFAAFNFGGADNTLLMSPTQAFHATMQTPTQATQEDSFDILRRIAPPSASSLPPLPNFETQDDEETQLSFVAGSQVPESQRINLNWETQPPETPVPAGLNRGVSALSETPGWEPTQDPGLPSPWSVGPKARRESTIDSLAEHETQSTVELRVSESPAPSQTGPKRGRLGHRRVLLLDDSDDEITAPPASVTAEKGDAFREMARRRKEALTVAEREDVEKEMRGMMEEQAEESEDEYAGLGGDDYVAPETEQDREMIDSSHIDVDERALAAHFAERQRLRDEEETSKLYKDLTTGVLRRKMGANAFDLDEDEDEIAARRRQMRQQEEARKRKALLKDENIATLAEGKQSKGKDAFLKAIADDDGDEKMVGLSDEEVENVPATQEESTQSQSQQPDAAPLREISGNKRKLEDDEETNEDRAPAKQRRTQASAFKRPTSLVEVKESVSFLLDDAAAFGPTTVDLSSDSENEELQQHQSEESEGDDEAITEAARQNDGGYAPNPMSMEAKSMPPPRLPASQRRTTPKPAVVDRLSLKRGYSSSSSSSNGHSRTAWAAGPTTGGFKVPSLLRRATTTSSNDRGVSTPVLSRENGGVKMGGTKKSSLAYQARAEERKAIVEASAKRRQENTAKIALMRRASSALGRGLTGRFE